MKNPETFEMAWSEAERRAFEKLTEAAGSDENRDAFLGRNPGIINAWHFESQPVTDIGESVLLARDLPTLGVPYRAECVYLKREDCQAWAMRVIKGLPLIQDVDSNIALFRVNALGQITHGTTEVANQQGLVNVWKIEIGFDLVFTTGGKSNSAIP